MTERWSTGVEKKRQGLLERWKSRFDQWWERPWVGLPVQATLLLGMLGLFVGFIRYGVMIGDDDYVLRAALTTTLLGGLAGLALGVVLSINAYILIGQPNLAFFIAVAAVGLGHWAFDGEADTVFLFFLILIAVSAVSKDFDRRIDDSENRVREDVNRLRQEWIDRINPPTPQ